MRDPCGDDGDHAKGRPAMNDTLNDAERGKRAAATKALDWIQDGMKVGLGTGSTAKWFVDLLAEHLAETGKQITAVPTSSRTRDQAAGLGIPLTTLGEAVHLDVTVDGADEFDGELNLVKGGGGALLQEKIVASASAQMVVISDPSKRVETLGAFPLPVEVVRFGWESTAREIAEVLEAAEVETREMARRETLDMQAIRDVLDIASKDKGFEPFDPWTPDERMLLTSRYRSDLFRVSQIANCSWIGKPPVTVAA